MNLYAPVIAFLGMSLAGAVCAFLHYDIQLSTATIATSHDQIAEITARDTFAKTAAQFLAQTSAERSAVNFFVLPTEGTAPAIELVEDASKVAGVKADVGSATLNPLSGPHNERLDISVSSESTFAGAARFATVLESLPRGAYLDSVMLRATDKGWYGTYLVSFIKQK